MRQLQPVTLGQYLGDSDFTTRSSKFVSDTAWQKLRRIRARYDPEGVFHLYLTADEARLNTNV